MSAPPQSNATPGKRTRTAYHFAIVRVVPHVHIGTFVNVGIVLHARTEEYLDARLITDRARLHALAPDVDTELLIRYLTCYEGICRGDPAAGPIALLPTSERFHWLTAPRSDVLQSSPVHAGLAEHLDQTLAELFDELVGS